MPTTINWPSDINPCFLLDDYLEEPQPITIRSPVDSGPRKIRRRFTKPYIGVLAAIIVDRQELARLNTFFYTTLQGGVLSFNKPHPYNGTTVEYRFLESFKLATVDDGSNFKIQLLLEQI